MQISLNFNFNKTTKSNRIIKHASQTRYRASTWDPIFPGRDCNASSPNPIEPLRSITVSKMLQRISMHNFIHKWKTAFARPQ